MKTPKPGLFSTLFEILNNPLVKIAALTTLSAVLFALIPFSIALGCVIILTFSFFSWSSKYLSILSLVFLSLIPVLLYFEFQTIAEQFAVYVYFLLVIVIVLELKSYILENIISIHKAPDKEFFFDSTTAPHKARDAVDQSTILEQELRESIAAAQEEEREVKFEETSDYKRNLVMWNVFVVVMSALLCFVVFRFSGLPYFRDLATLPFYFNLDSAAFDLFYIERSVYNALVNLRISPVHISSAFYQLFFFGGLISTYYFTLKIQDMFQENKALVYSYRNKILVLLLSLFFVFNPFTFERFLMGQYNVLRGHLFLVPVMYYLLRYLETFLPERFKHQQTNAFEQFTRFSWAITLLSLVSAHHTYFVYALAGVSLVFILFTEIITHNHGESEFPYFTRFFSLSTLSLLVILPSLFIMFNRYVVRDSSQNNFYESSISENRDYKNDVISAFSAKNFEGTNIYNQVIIGAGSWMTPSFIEPQNIVADNAWANSALYYFNEYLAWIVIILLTIIGFNIAWVADKSFKPLLYPFIFALPLSLILSFGYSGGAKIINQLYFYTPLSYLMREPGKFYSLFLFLCVLAVSVYYFKIHKTFRILLSSTMVFLVGSNILLFNFLPSYTLYSDLPESMISVVDDNCNEGELVMFYPFDTYVLTSYSDTFVLYPYEGITECNGIHPRKATTVGVNGDEILLFESSVSETIDEATEEYIESNNEESDYKVYKDIITSFDIRLVVIDSTHSNDLSILEEHLDSYLMNISEDDEVSIYRLP